MEREGLGRILEPGWGHGSWRGQESGTPYGTAQHDLGGQLDRSLGGDSSTGAREGTAQ